MTKEEILQEFWDGDVTDHDREQYEEVLIFAGKRKFEDWLDYEDWFTAWDEIRDLI